MVKDKNHHLLLRGNNGKPVDVETLRKNAWTAGLSAADITYRTMIQTRLTFATLMLTAGVNIGWVEKITQSPVKSPPIFPILKQTDPITHTDKDMHLKGTMPPSP